MSKGQSDAVRSGPWVEVGRVRVMEDERVDVSAVNVDEGMEDEEWTRWKRESRVGWSVMLACRPGGREARGTRGSEPKVNLNRSSGLESERGSEETELPGGVEEGAAAVLAGRGKIQVVVEVGGREQPSISI